MKLPDASKCQRALPALKEMPHSLLVETLLIGSLKGDIKTTRNLCPHTLTLSSGLKYNQQSGYIFHHMHSCRLVLKHIQHFGCFFLCVYKVP